MPAFTLFNDEEEDRQREQARQVLRGEKDPSEVGFSPFTTSVTSSKADQIHEDRSEVEQETDEAFNAPITTDFEKWKESPNRYDYPGVDTVPAGKAEERAERKLSKAKEEGIVTDVNRGASFEGGVRGRASWGEDGTEVMVSGKVEEGDEPDPRFKKGPVLSHEVGHAVDHAADFGFRDLVKENDELREEAISVSEQMRGTFETASDERKQYRAEDPDTGSKELFADFFASATVQPRATKRQAPKLTEAVQDQSNIGEIFDNDNSVF